MADIECGCSGVRHCLICESTSRSTKVISQTPNDTLQNIGPDDLDVYHFCLASFKINFGEWKYCSCCSKQEEFLKGTEVIKDGKEEDRTEPGRQKLAVFSRMINKGSNCVQFISLKGELARSPLLLGLQDIVVIEDFVSEREEMVLKSEIYNLPWKPSQSGRRKQDFGPQANFKRRKLKIGNFTGLPFFLEDVVSKFKSFKSLVNFLPVEVCHLEYCPTRGSSIDPHIDDTWLWGERLVTLNLLSSSILTLSNDACDKVIVQVPLPRRSLLVLQGRARNIWKHSIERRNIVNVRLALTFRELSTEFISGSQADYGKEILKIASNYDGKPLHYEQDCK